MDIKDKQLIWKNNERLEKTTPTNCEYTAAWSNVGNIVPVSQVVQPSLDDVVEAKDWVDNGSKL